MHIWILCYISAGLALYMVAKHVRWRHLKLKFKLTLSTFFKFAITTLNTPISLVCLQSSIDKPCIRLKRRERKKTNSWWWQDSNLWPPDQIHDELDHNMSYFSCNGVLGWVIANLNFALLQECQNFQFSPKIYKN